MNEEQAREQFADVTSDVIQQMIRLTCIVHYRAECIGCISSRLHSRFNEDNEVEARAAHLKEAENVDDVHHALDKYLRHVIIWAKEETEKEMTKPCSIKEHADVLPPGLAEALFKM